ncbi:DsbA family protein [Novosphingobium sp. ZN18A2]|uniref:DsbA family protein n=1 Tax=Novosphingobium sp. ZN18A2 TaxID=3079861 RepID=UPI0030CBDE72
MTLRSILAALAAVAMLGAAPQAMAGNIAQTMAVFTDNPLAPKVTPRSYDVTIVEYFDYACPYCKRMEPVLEQLVASDHKVRIVYRDWPVIRPESRIAARLAIASQYQGKHAAFHDALFNVPGRLNDQSIRAAAKTAGVDWKRLEADEKAHAADIDKLLAETDFHAQKLGLQGTPALLVGNHLLRGAVDLPTLKRVVAAVRAEEAGGNAPA